MNDSLNPANLKDEDIDDLLDATLGALRSVYLEMLEPDWRFAVKRLKTAEPEQYKQAVRAQVYVLQAIQELELSELDEILDALRQNAPDLRKARKELREAVKDMEKVAEVVDAVAGFLKVVNVVLGHTINLLI